jgi:hypothetical protein
MSISASRKRTFLRQKDFAFNLWTLDIIQLYIMQNATKYDWIPYTKPQAEGHTKPHKRRHSFAGLIITKSKKIALPRSFCLQNTIKNYRYAVFYFDASIPAIGIEFMTSKQPGSARITWNTQAEAASLSCSSFFRACGLDSVMLARRYAYTVSQTEEGRPLYVITLAERG